MSRMKLFSGLMGFACAAWMLPALALSPTEQPSADSHPHIAQSAADLGGTHAADQPTSTEDLTLDDLTPEQAAQIQTIFDTYAPQVEQATEAYTEAVAAMLDVLKPETSAQILAEARADLLAAERDLDDLTFERNLAIREVLTQQQRQTINDYVRAALGL